MKTIVAKKYGRNLVIVIDDKKITKVINTEEDKKIEESVKNKILRYNKKNNEILKDEIIKLIDKTIVENENKIIEKKGIKKSIKNEIKSKKNIKKEKLDIITELESKELSIDDINKLEKLLQKTKKIQKTEEIKSTEGIKRKGEY
jgi:hypothetical protein